MGPVNAAETDSDPLVVRGPVVWRGAGNIRIVQERPRIGDAGAMELRDAELIGSRAARRTVGKPPLKGHLFAVSRNRRELRRAAAIGQPMIRASLEIAYRQLSAVRPIGEREIAATGRNGAKPIGVGS